MKQKQLFSILAVLFLLMGGLTGSSALLGAEAEKADNSICGKVKQGDLKCVKEMVSKDEKQLNYKSDTGNTLLHEAVLQQKEDVVAYLIQKGLDVNAPNKWKYTPLHFAVLRNNLPLLKMLQENGGDVNLKVESGATPVAWAVAKGNTKMAAFLLDQGADPGYISEKTQRSLAHFAVLNGNKAVMAKLLEKGAPVNTKDTAGFTPVDYAFNHGNKFIAKMLVKKGYKPAEGTKKRFGFSPLLKKNLPEKTAAVWYLGHCGWAVKTASKLLIFDYWRYSTDAPATPLLANGHINPEELADLDVYVFVSHDHGDHYDTVIHEWKDKMKSVTYVFGFQDEKFSDYVYMAPKTKKKLGDMKIVTFEAADAGVSFLIKTDGMSVFHAGDHFNKSEDCSGPFMADMKKIAGWGIEVDLAFLPAGGGCSFGKPEVVQKGLNEAAKLLKPKAFFPMHRLLTEYMYREVAEKMKEAGVSTPIICAQDRGNHFVYKKGKITKL